MENNQPNPLIPEPKIDDAGLVELAERRKVEADKKRKIFKKVSRVVMIIVLLIVSVFIGLYIYKAIQKEAPAVYTVATPEEPKEEDKPSVFDTTRPDSWTLYKSDKLKLFIRMPSITSTIETSDPAAKVEVVYDKNKPDTTSGSPTDLTEGYIFRVTPLDIGIRDIEAITKIKMDSFRLQCPEAAVFSEAKKTLIDTIDARSFEITKCDSDYVIYYVPRFNIYYEIALIYKGDVGYKQKYRATLDEMTRAFKFFPEDTPPIGPFATFVDEQSKVVFTHPNLSETCCTLPKPPVEVGTVVMLGDKTTFKDDENFDGIGVFTSNLWGVSGGFDQFVENQKKLLIEDYKVVKGVTPEVTSTETKMGKFRAIRLSGYSWRGNDLIYAEIPGNYGANIVILSIKNISGASFEATVQQVLNTFETY